MNQLIVGIELEERFAGEKPDKNIIDRTDAEQQREWLHVALALALDIIANHVSWSPEKLSDGAENAAVEVGDQREDVFDHIKKGKATRIALLTTLRTEVSDEVGATVLADARLCGCRLFADKSRLEAVDLQNAQKAET